MIYVSDEKEYLRLQQQNLPVLKATFSQNTFVDAWLAEQPATTSHNHTGEVEWQHTANGLFGSISVPAGPSLALDTVTQQAYTQVLEALARHPRYTIIRFWNYVPDITAPVQAGNTAGENRYHLFNAGRQKAFSNYYGQHLAQEPIPAASAVGTQSRQLTIEFLAVTNPIQQLENKNQIPAWRYSARYGKHAPLFSRGVIYNNNGQRLLLSSGTASITGEDSQHPGDIYEQLCQSIHNLRILAAQFNLKQYNIHYGFALEDIALLRVYYKNEEDLPFLQRFVPRFLAPACQVSFIQANICREELLVELEAVFIKKGETENGIRPKYYLQQNRIRTESFEIHVAEHCNLKCRDCCNISPFNAQNFITPEEVTNICSFVNQHLLPDVFKVAGGEPTLHPQLDQILQIIKQSGAGKVVRVVSNGLLLHRMTDTFWQNIDQLTISNYISAPVKPALLEQIKNKARQYEVVLNIKYVDQFNEIFVDEPITDTGRVQQIYNDCWMRHRCLIVRNGRFFKCTRAAYMDDFMRIKKMSAAAGNSTYTQEDGILLSETDFQQKALEYLNTDTPLLSCEYCLGVSGNLRENIQLKTAKVVS